MTRIRSFVLCLTVLLAVLVPSAWSSSRADTVAGCPGCRLRRLDIGNLGRVYGTPTVVPNPLSYAVLRTWTWIYPWGWMSQDYSIPNPTQNVPFSHYVAGTQATLQAEIIWTFPLGPVSLTASTPLIVE